MSRKERDYRKRYEELMRGAGRHRRLAVKRALEVEFRHRDLAARRKRQRAAGTRVGKLMHVTAMLDAEVVKLQAKLADIRDPEERVLIKAEIAHFEAVMRSLRSNQRPRRGSFDEGKRRKPPEAGIPVPAVPPNGPLPKQGGAEAPLDFSD